MGARKEAYKKLNRKITDFGWGWPGQVPALEKGTEGWEGPALCRPKEEPPDKGSSRHKCPKAGDSGWPKCGWIHGGGGEVG